MEVKLDKKDRIYITHAGSAWAYEISVDEQDDLQFNRQKPKKKRETYDNFENWDKGSCIAFLTYLKEAHQKQLNEYFKEWQYDIKIGKKENYEEWEKEALVSILNYMGHAHPKQLNEYFQEWQHSLN